MSCRAIALRTDGAVALAAVVRTELGTAYGSRNDALFALCDGGAAMVHLTWHSIVESDPRRPAPSSSPALGYWVGQNMMPDRRE